MASLLAQTVIESTSSVGNLGSIPHLGRSAGEENGYPLQYSCLENSMDRGDWQATVPGVTKCRTRLNDFHFLCFSMRKKNENVNFLCHHR